jgi:AraC family transcriptional regulator, ethanolamine operon transcriptional activator
VLHHARRLILEPDGFDGAVSGMSLNVEFQRRQERTSSIEQFQSPEWALDFGEANVKTRVQGVLLGGWASFCFARGPGEGTWNSQSAGPGTITLLPPGEELQGCTTPGFSWVTAAVPPAVWQRCLALAGIQHAEPRRLTVCHLPGDTLARIEHGLRGLRRSLDHTADAALNAELRTQDAAAFAADCFTDLCEQASSTPQPRDSLHNRARLARRADAWMRAHLSTAFQMPDVCLALRVSRRELEYAFRAVFDQSPRHYLQNLRLNAIRRALLGTRRGRHSLIEIAHDHGITHLSRFAAHYRALFGETPRATLRGRR